MKNSSKFVGFALGLALCSNSAMAQAGKVDASIPAYSKVSGVSGNLSSIGSDSLNNLMTLWAEGFKRQYPNVRIQIEGKGSSTAPPALISGTAQLGPMSREMKQSEIDEFEKKYGYKPTLIKVAVDGLAVYVHKDNPIEQLTFQQIDAAFSKTRACGAKKAVATWGDFGLSGEWAKKPISLYGRNSASGTYGFFKENALCKGDFRDQVKEQPGSASVVQGVTSDLGGMGYSGLGYKTSGVKAIKVAKVAGQFWSDEAENVLSGKYPLARYLYIYINQSPSKPLDPMIREFLRFVLSQEGQQNVVKDGYLAIPNTIVNQEKAKLK